MSINTDHVKIQFILPLQTPWRFKKTIGGLKNKATLDTEIEPP